MPPKTVLPGVCLLFLYEAHVLAALSLVWEEQERIDPMDGRVFPRSVSGEYGLG
jgi:hypothetical protein